jgi:metallo-beta-lactamase class B
MVLDLGVQVRFPQQVGIASTQQAKSQPGGRRYRKRLFHWQAELIYKSRQYNLSLRPVTAIDGVDDMIRKMTTICLLAWLAGPVLAQNPAWTNPYPAFHIIGPLYGVGTEDLSAFLITTDEGHILVNTGLAGSIDIIRDNMDSVGYRLEDIRILLTTQSHFDHTADLAAIKDASGARMLATAKDARVLEDGGLSDPHFGGEVSFDPIEVDEIIGEGDIIELGELRLMVHEHPGHTEGSSSYTFTVNENGRDYRVGIMNMGSINAGKRLLDDPTYDGVAADFAYTYATQKTMPVDIWVASHAAQYGLHDKYRPGQAYSPDTFVDPEGLLRAVEALEKAFLDQLSDEQIRTAYPE